MEEHYEAEKDYIDSLFPCEIDFMDELLESGSTWANAKSLYQNKMKNSGNP